MINLLSQAAGGGSFNMPTGQVGGVGYNEGLAEGLQDMAGIEQSHDQHKLATQRIISEKLKYKMQEQALQDQQLQRRLIANAFSTKALDKNIKEDYNTNSDLANKLIKLGQSIMPLDPGGGISMINEGKQLQTAAQKERLDGMQIQVARAKFVGEVSIGVNDQESLNEAVESLSKAGVNVPPKYRVWNDETKNYFQQQAKGSEGWKRIQDAENRAEKIKIDRAEADRKKHKDAAKELREEKQDALLRAGVSKGGYKEPKFEDIMLYQTSLSEASEDFKDLKPGEKVRAAQDYFRRAFAHSMAGVTDPATAFALAQDEIISRIDKKSGKYTGWEERPEKDPNEKATEHTEKNPAKISSQAEFDALPSGALFINPANGKLLRKK